MRLFSCVIRSLLLSIMVCCAALAEPAQPVPNVLFIVVDTLRADHVGFHGYPRKTTPNLDRLASESVVFRNAMSVTSWTTPSIAALLTSRYPSEVSPEFPPVVLPPHVQRLPQLFQARGHATGAVISHYGLGRTLKFDIGFDSFDESEARGIGHVSSPGVTDRAIAFLDQHRRSPFFLFVHYFDPHYEYRSHEGYDFGSGSYEGPVRPGMTAAELDAIVPDLGPADREHLVALYDSEIAFTDHHIGRLLDRLRELDLFQRTLIVLTADHGEEFMERRWVGHGKTLHRESIHVPLLFKPPGESDARVVDSVVSLVDVPPTICHLSGLPWPAEHPSRGVALRLDRPEPADGRLVFAQLGPARAAIDGRWKLLTRDLLGTARLYDLEQDPRELSDVLEGRRKIARRLLHRLDRFAESLRVEADGSRPEYSDEERENLKALGYLR